MSTQSQKTALRKILRAEKNTDCTITAWFWKNKRNWKLVLIKTNSQRIFTRTPVSDGLAKARWLSRMPAVRH